MTKNTLDYLLSIAGQPAPQVQQSNFAETGNVDFAYLRENHYLVDNGRLGGTIMVLGESMQVYRDPVTGKCFYYDDCGISEDFPPELLRLSDVVFTPLAVLLGETYRCDSTPEELVKNALWYIGVPEAGGAEVYLARNIGTNAEVRDKIADFTKEITVLWFGRCPGRRDTDATLCQLSSFLRWDGKAIIHRDAWPQSINDSADRSARRRENALIYRGDFWELWHQGEGPKKLDDTNGCWYIARILEAQGERLSPLEVAPPEDLPETRPFDKDRKEENDLERPLENYTVEELTTIRNSLKGLKSKEAAARGKGRTEEADELKGQYDEALAVYNKATRPGGRSTMTSDQMGNVKKRIRVARDGICDKLASWGGVFAELGKAWKKDIKIGNECYYAPAQPTVWQVERRRR